MGFLGNLFGTKSPPTDAVKRSVTTKDDGSQTVTTSFTLQGGDTRPVRDDVVTAFDDALGRLGGGHEVMHAMDPSRLLSFEAGGPPIWSVGMVEVPGATPYTLLLTYGFSHVLSPEPLREGLSHEYSFAIPRGAPLSPWADAFLRHQTRYILTQGNDIRLNDCVPFRGVPMTRIPFSPIHHAMMPDSTLVGLVCARDPVLPRIETAHGPVEVRRLVCLDQAELDWAETWSTRGLLEELEKVDPLLLSPLARPSRLDDPAFAAVLERRFSADGSERGAALFDLSWQVAGDDAVLVELPTTDAARHRLLRALRGRLGFGRPLTAASMRAPVVQFEPGAPALATGPRGLLLRGSLTEGPPASLVRALEAGEHGPVLLARS
jgi:hypothetical protein